MTTNNFRAIAYVLQQHISGTYALLAAADAVEKILPTLGPLDPETVDTPVPVYTGRDHEALVDAALRSRACMTYMRETKKIGAIKHLRTLTGAGLRDAKNAVEDERILIATGYPSSY